MHTLFEEVLTKRDLSKAGMLFSLEDKEIEKDLSEVVQGIHAIADSDEYEISDNDQSVVEICITRVNTAIRETSSIEENTGALVDLLAMCQKHRLAQTSKDEDPPHAKIASDIMSCLFMYYNKSSVMQLAIPAAVKLLDCENRDLCRSVSSYLSLAAIDNADLLAEHTQLIVVSVLEGNYILGQVLPQIYQQNTEPVHQHLPQLVSVMDACEPNDRIYLLQLMGAVAKKEPKLLEEHVETMCKYLDSSNQAPTVLMIFVDLALASPACMVPHRDAITAAVKQQPVLICQAAQILGTVGTVDEEEGKKSIEYLASQLNTTDPTYQPLVLQEIRGVGQAHHHLLQGIMGEVDKQASSGSSAVRLLVQQIKEDNKKYQGEKEVRSVSSQTEGTVTIITVGNPPNATHPSGTISVKHTLLPPSGGDSQQSLGKASSGSTVRLASERAGSPTSTLVSENTSYSGGAFPMGQNSGEPGRDGVQQFCEKHLTKIKGFINKLNASIPLPIKCSVVNGKHKRYVRLYFVCGRQSGQCLYSNQHFIVNTRLPKLWIHLMFLSVQANASAALSQRDTDVSCLKACWDALKGERNSSFLTVVTSSFPTQKDQLALLHELHEERYFDVFEFNAVSTHWACFMCNHPEKVSSLMQNGLPEIEVSSGCTTQQNS
ncbi:hypothetical protein V1264_007332 [Littorina saxatilis]|uniref:Uncharacterized protein n=1 Tax=Littorina saxatilis TaxID=31220 RepID=A0AAN9AUR2_9CAEN